MKGYKWIRNDVADFQLISLKESLRMFEEGGTGILYYGYTECAWCNRAVPELNEVAKELNLTIYYVDASAKVEKEDYKKLLEYIDPVLKVNSSGEKGFYVPAVIGVKNGKLAEYHVSLLDSFELSRMIQTSSYPMHKSKNYRISIAILQNQSLTNEMKV